MSHVTRQELCGQVLCRHVTCLSVFSGALLSQRDVQLVQSETVKLVGHS